MSKITMVVPTYNDLESLTSLLHLVEKQKSKRVTYLIVNNGSTNKEIDHLLRRNSEYWKSINLESNLGFGGGILEGIKAANTIWIGWMPGNLKIKPIDVEKLVENISLESRTFVKCHRMRTSKSARMKTFIAGLIQSVITRKNLFDTGGTPTICERDFVLSLNNLPTDFVIESRMLFEARNHGLIVRRPLIPYGERVFGSSHWQRGIASEITLMRKIWKSARTWQNI